MLHVCVYGCVCHLIGTKRRPVNDSDELPRLFIFLCMRLFALPAGWRLSASALHGYFFCCWMPFIFRRPPAVLGDTVVCATSYLPFCAFVVVVEVLFLCCTCNQKIRLNGAVKCNKKLPISRIYIQFFGYFFEKVAGGKYFRQALRHFCAKFAHNRMLWVFYFTFAYIHTFILYTTNI